MRILLTALFVAAATPALAQHDHTHPPTTHQQPEPQDSTSHTMSIPPLGVPHTREASGTAWQPDATPMHAIHSMHGSWMTMLHGNLFAGYGSQQSARGDADHVFGVGWIMGMAQRQLVGGQFGLRAMLSPEPFMMEQSGYPLLLQTGEAFEGVPLHDRQHPHDLFMEIAATYAHELSNQLAFQLYAAPSGEPALGPVAFPHRMSASSDPLAPLSHHWQDSSHITFGVLTAGLFTRSFKLEGSWFNGREPDDKRYDFDFHELDSYSGRLSFNPGSGLSLQTSYGFLERPEELEPEVSLHRVTTSVAHAAPFAASGNCATLLVWGRNVPSSGRATDGFLLESNLALDGRHTVFGRGEFVQKSAHELVVPGVDEHEVFDVGSVVLGYLFEFARPCKYSISAGIRVSVNFIEEDLEPLYGMRRPAGFMLFLRAWPQRTAMHSMMQH